MAKRSSPPPWADDVQRRSEAFLKYVRGKGRPFVSRATVPKSPQRRLEHLYLMHGMAGGHQGGPDVPHGPALDPVDPELVRDIPEDIRDLFLHQRPEDRDVTLDDSIGRYSDDELRDLVASDPLWLTTAPVQERILSRQNAIQLGDKHTGKLARKFLEGLGRALIPTKERQLEKWYDEQLMAKWYLKIEELARRVNGAYLEAAAAESDLLPRVQRLSTLLDARLSLPRELEEMLGDGDRVDDEAPSTEEDAKLFLATLCGVVTASEDEAGRQVVIGSDGWPRGATLAFLAALFDVAPKTIRTAVRKAGAIRKAAAEPA